MRFNGVKYQIVDNTKGSRRVSVDGNKIIFNYPCSNQSDCTPYKLLFSPGYYQIELWGAYGGDGRYGNNVTIREGSGGKGAYVSGKIAISGTQELYLYIGGRGEDQIDIYKNRSLGGYNGGGNGGVDLVDTNFTESSAGGGGSTDLRLVNKQDFSGWKSRILVAAGGGGGVSSNNRYNDYNNFLGGDGGTLNGSSTVPYSVGGTQTTGIFGYGQNGFDFDGDTFRLGGSTGGSGGGYYGGYVKKYEGSAEFQETAGAGGSSYISGYNECIAIKYESTENNIIPSLNSYHYSHLYFDEGIMKQNGDEGFIDQYEESIFDQTQNGVARITIIKTFESLPIFCTFPKQFHITFPKSLVLITICMIK